MKPQPPFLFRHRFVCLGALAGLCVLFTASASLHGQIIYNQSFDSPLGGIPSDWTLAPGFNASNGVSQIDTRNDENWLHQRRTVNTGGANGNSFVYYSGDFGDGAVENGLLSDFSASAIFQLTGAADGDGRGVMVRAGNPGTTPTGYYIYIADNKLSISLNPTNSTSGRGTLLASSSQTLSLTINSDVSYLFSVSAQGETVSGAIYAWDTETSSFSMLLADVSVENSTYSSGYFGFRTSYTNSSRSVYWRDATITVVPEPSVAMLLAPTAGLFLLRRSRRK